MLVKIAPFVFVCLWATGFIGARLGMPYSEPGTFLTIRFSIACLLLLGLAFAMRAKWPDRATILWCIAIGFALHGIYLGGVFWAIDGGMWRGRSGIGSKHDISGSRYSSARLPQASSTQSPNSAPSSYVASPER